MYFPHHGFNYESISTIIKPTTDHIGIYIVGRTLGIIIYYRSTVTSLLSLQGPSMQLLFDVSDAVMGSR